ncbi:MAG TPA: hypothetical protein EYN66_12095 [Myxococcales bacterium]|nr:hypothetical protein [Myxococcales bacterium]
MAWISPGYGQVQPPKLKLVEKDFSLPIRFVNNSKCNLVVYSNGILDFKRRQWTAFDNKVDIVKQTIEPGLITMSFGRKIRFWRCLDADWKKELIAKTDFSNLRFSPDGNIWVQDSDNKWVEPVTLQPWQSSWSPQPTVKCSKKNRVCKLSFGRTTKTLRIQKERFRWDMGSPSCRKATDLKYRYGYSPDDRYFWVSVRSRDKVCGGFQCLTYVYRRMAFKYQLVARTAGCSVQWGKNPDAVWLGSRQGNRFTPQWIDLTQNHYPKVWAFREAARQAVNSQNNSGLEKPILTELPVLSDTQSIRFESGLWNNGNIEIRNSVLVVRDKKEPTSSYRFVVARNGLHVMIDQQGKHNGTLQLYKTD